VIEKMGGNKELSPSPAIASVHDNYPEEKTPAAEEIAPEPVYTQVCGKIKPGDTFSKALSRQKQISPAVRQQLIQTLSDSLDFRRLKPGDKYTITLDENNELVGCSYEASPLEIYTVNKNPEEQDSFTSRREAIPLEVKTTYFKGEMHSSLFEAFISLNESSRLVYAFADIFASQIDFNTEPRQQDTFEGIVEKYYKNGDFIGYGKILYAKYAQQDGTVYEGFYFNDNDSIDGHFNLEGEELGTFFIKSPLPIGRVTSRFTWRRKHPILGVVRPHLGIDLAAPKGTPVMAASDGKVAFKGVNGGYGKQIILSHNGGYKTYYGHLSRYAKGLKKGSRVSQKQIIGYVGSTGLSTGPHLDYRLKLGSRFLNPLSTKFKPRSVLSGADLIAFKKDTEKIALYLEKKENNILFVRQEVVEPKDAISIL
jgi:murein DD-endopeptidase MepM/ murein hydrolase activator NlpD